MLAHARTTFLPNNTIESLCFEVEVLPPLFENNAHFFAFFFISAAVIKAFSIAERKFERGLEVIFLWVPPASFSAASQSKWVKESRNFY